MTATVAAVLPALSGLQPPPDGTELRLLAARLSDTAGRLAASVDQLASRTSHLTTTWTGTAAAAALSDLDGLQQRGVSAAEVHREAAHVLQVCAGRLDEAAATWRRAEALEWQDAMERTVVSVVAASTRDETLRWQARQLAEQAQAEHLDAVARANAELHDLADRALVPGVPRLTTADHIIGLGRGAVDAVWGSVVTVAGLSLPRLLADPAGWRDAVTGVRDGASYALGHPREAAAAMIGWDQLRDGRYGEWLGSLAPDLLSGAFTGGALPIARRSADLAEDLGDLAEDVDDLQRVHGRGVNANAGGPVLPGPGVPPGYVTRVNDLTPERRRHILDGDPHGRGGGHRHGSGRGKSEFPADWDDDLIIQRVMQTARAPQRGVWNDKNQSFNVMAQFDGVTVLVAVDRLGNVKTGYPIRRGRR